MGDKVIYITDDNFKAEILESDKPVLLDFWAEWCGPCKRIAPIIDAVAGEMADKIKVAKLDIEESSAIAANYGIRSIPTLLIISNGEVIATQVGGLSRTQLVEFIDKNI